MSRSRSPRRVRVWQETETLGTGSSAKAFKVESQSPFQTCALRVLNEKTLKDPQWKSDFEDQMRVTHFFAQSPDPSKNVHPSILACDAKRGSCIMSCGQSLSTYLRSAEAVPSEDVSLPESLLKQLKMLACAGFFNSDVKPQNTVIVSHEGQRFIQLIDIDRRHCIYLDPVLKETLEKDQMGSSEICQVIRMFNYLSMVFLFFSHVEHWYSGARRQVFLDVLKKEMGEIGANLRVVVGPKLREHIQSFFVLFEDLAQKHNKEELIRRGVRLEFLEDFKENILDLGSANDEVYDRSDILWLLSSMSIFYFGNQVVHAAAKLFLDLCQGGEGKLAEKFCPPKAVLRHAGLQASTCLDELSDASLDMPPPYHIEPKGKGLWHQTKS